MKVGQFPYQPGGNPYQELFSECLEEVGIGVARIPPRKILPLNFALSHEIDILHLDWPHDWYSGKNRLTTIIKRSMYFQGLGKLRKFPCVWTAHNLVSHDANDKWDEKAMIQALIDCCDGIMVMSHAAEQKLIETYRVASSTIIEVIPHGHYVDAYENEISQSDSRRDLGIEAASRVVLTLGRILPYKGIDELIDSFNRVANEDDVLIVAGPVSDQSYLRNLQEMANRGRSDGARILIKPGYVPDGRLQYYFNASDVVALPFKEILNSGSLLLAMSFGRCVVAPRAGSIPEIACSDGYFGYDPDHPNGLSDAIIAAMSREDLLAKGRLMKAHAVNNYAWNDIGVKLKSLYQRILQN